MDEPFDWSVTAPVTIIVLTLVLCGLIIVEYHNNKNNLWLIILGGIVACVLLAYAWTQFKIDEDRPEVDTLFTLIVLLSIYWVWLFFSVSKTYSPLILLLQIILLVWLIVLLSSNVLYIVLLSIVLLYVILLFLFNGLLIDANKWILRSLS